MNLDLVANATNITLCPTCFKDPLGYPFSIANGYDYGRISNLPDLNLVTKNSISLVRIVRKTINLNSQTHSSYARKFNSNGPQVCAKTILEALDEKYIPQVTFIGSKDKWRIEKEKIQKLIFYFHRGSFFLARCFMRL